MSRYIDAEKLDEIVQNLNAHYEVPISRYEYKRISGVLCEFPTADVAEVRHGKWKQKAWIDEEMEVHEDILVTKCSECGMRTYWLKGEKLWNYCPNCGARMDGERRDDV